MEIYCPPEQHYFYSQASIVLYVVYIILTRLFVRPRFTRRKLNAAREAPEIEHVKRRTLEQALCNPLTTCDLKMASTRRSLAHVFI